MRRQLKLKFLVELLTLLCGVSVCTGKGEVKLSKHPVVIIVSYDGFRYDYLNKTETPNLDRVKEGGVSVPYMQNQFLTYTFPNHHSIATGLFIESHGIVANALYDPLYNKTLSGYNDDPGFWNYSSAVLPLWAVNELAGDGRFSGVMMWPGSAEPFGINDTLSSHIKKYNNSYPYESRVDDVISWITDEEKPANLVFLYCEEPDSTGHKHGPEGPEVVTQIQRMDNLTGYLLNKLESLNIRDQVNLIFLSDHGMQEVKLDSIIQHESIISNPNNSKYLQSGSSPVLQILPVKENETMEIYSAFQSASESMNFTVYLKTNMSDAKPQWHYSRSRRIMPILLVANLGFVFQDYSGNSNKGTHGYDSDLAAMHPYFIANGPLFKSKSIQQPFSNTDIYPLVCHVMGMEAPPNNGTLENVLPLLSNFTRDHNRKAIQPQPSKSWIRGSDKVH